MTKGRGKNKILPEDLARQFLQAFEKDQYEVNIGKTGLLRTLQRLSPELADRMVKNG
jgi:hypothetical protein